MSVAFLEILLLMAALGGPVAPTSVIHSQPLLWMASTTMGKGLPAFFLGWAYAASPVAMPAGPMSPPYPPPHGPPPLPSMTPPPPPPPQPSPHP